MWACLIPATMFLSNHSSAQKLPLALLVGHYVYRSFLYPFWLQQPKQTPFHVWLAASGFVLCNSILQVSHALQHTSLRVNSAFMGVRGAFRTSCCELYYGSYAHACHNGINRASVHCRACSLFTVTPNQCHWRQRSLGCACGQLVYTSTSCLIALFTPCDDNRHRKVCCSTMLLPSSMHASVSPLLACHLDPLVLSSNNLLSLWR